VDVHHSLDATQASGYAKRTVERISRSQARAADAGQGNLADRGEFSRAKCDPGPRSGTVALVCKRDASTLPQAGCPDLKVTHPSKIEQSLPLFWMSGRSGLLCRRTERLTGAR
jgi:hypothetical protein